MIIKVIIIIIKLVLITIVVVIIIIVELTEHMTNDFRLMTYDI